MQPNQQDPNEQSSPTPVSPTSVTVSSQPVSVIQDPYSQSSSTTSQPSQVPDYLHLEPIVDPEQARRRKRKRTLKLIAIALVAIAILAAILAAYQYIQNNTADKKFYRAIDQQMQTKYISRKYTLKDRTNATGGLITVDSDSDFTDPSAPKSKLSYTSKNSSNSTINGNLVMFSFQKFYAQITQTSANIKSQNLATNMWYTVSGSVDARQRNLLDSLGLRVIVNSPLNYVVTGNFSSSDRQQLITSLKANNIYNILDSHSDQLDGKPVTVYTVTFDAQKMQTLNSTYADKIKIQIPDRTLVVANFASKMTFWIDDSTDQIKKTTFSTKYVPGDLKLDAEIDSSYPSSESIAIPSNATKGVSK